MKKLLFLTDRFPYENGEAFIENEISILEQYFDKVIIFPSGMMVSTKSQRKCGENTIIIPPANRCSLKDIEDKGLYGKILWGIRYLLGWSMMSIFSIDLYHEIEELNKNHNITFKCIMAIVRTEAINIRNMYFLSKHIDKMFDKGDEVYLYSYWLNPSIMHITKLINNRGIKIRKIVARTHRNDLYINERKTNYIPFHKKMIEEVDEVVTISKNGFEYLSQLYPNYISKIKMSYLGTKDYGLQRYIRQKKISIVSCSTIVSVKRVELIIEALALINDINIEWIHFGDGILKNEKLALANKLLNGKPNIEYKFVGQVSNDKIIKYYKENPIDVFINVSKSEGLPVSLMEAASFGIPLIATDVGGTKEVLHSYLNGVLLDKDITPKKIAESIMFILNLDISEYMKYRNCSRKIWEQSFNAEINYEKFVNKCLLDVDEL